MLMQHLNSLISGIYFIHSTATQLVYCGHAETVARVLLVNKCGEDPMSVIDPRHGAQQLVVQSVAIARSQTWCTAAGGPVCGHS